MELREHRAVGTQSFANTELDRSIELSCGNTELWEHTAVGTLN